MELSRINSAPVPATGNPYSQATRFGDLLFVSGQVAFDADSGTAMTGDFAAQTRRVLDNLRTVLEHSGSSLAAVLKTTCFLTKMENAAEFNVIYREVFPTDLPARSTVQVAALGPGFLVEVEAVAVCASR